MMTLCRLFAILAGLTALLAAPSAPRADIQAESAANYIRLLFDTSMRSVPDPAFICGEVAQFGRFAAGHAWQLLSSTERSRFADGFCDLTVDAVARLHLAYPGLRLEFGHVLPAAQGMAVVSTTVTRLAKATAWQVDWQVAPDDNRPGSDHLRLADMRFLGLSLGIFLRSLANADISRDSSSAEGIVAPWRRALDRALPSHPEPAAIPPK